MGRSKISIAEHPLFKAVGDAIKDTAMALYGRTPPDKPVEDWFTPRMTVSEEYKLLGLDKIYKWKLVNGTSTDATPFLSERIDGGSDRGETKDEEGNA